MSLELYDELPDRRPTWPAAVVRSNNHRFGHAGRQGRRTDVPGGHGEPGAGAALPGTAAGEFTAGVGAFGRGDFRRNEFGNWAGEPDRCSALSPTWTVPPIPSTAPTVWTDATEPMPRAAYSPPPGSGWFPRCWSRLRGAGLTGANAIGSVLRTDQDRAPSRLEW